MVEHSALTVCVDPEHFHRDIVSEEMRRVLPDLPLEASAEDRRMYQLHRDLDAYETIHARFPLFTPPGWAALRETLSESCPPGPCTRAARLPRAHPRAMTDTTAAPGAMYTMQMTDPPGWALRLEDLKAGEEKDDLFLIHSIWLRRGEPLTPPPERYDRCLASWKHHHSNEGILHVLWNGRAAADFLQTFHPARRALYESLLTEAQQADYLRVLLLHTYGGLYVDIDCECRRPLIEGVLLSHAPLLLLESPLYCEEYTNCLMGCLEAGHPFWMVVADLVEQTVTAVRTGSGLSKTTRFYFHLPLLGGVIQALFTNRITGPLCIDRALVRKPQFARDVHVLPHREFYDGGLAVHHEAGEWFSSSQAVTARVILVCLLATVACAVMLPGEE